MLLFESSCKKKKDDDVSGSSNGFSFLHTNGTDILDANGQKITLQGVAFGNEVWSNVEVPANHHSEIDFVRVKNMGMNAVRFYMNYTTFEDDAQPYVYKQAGWDWIDVNIEWARKAGVYLILNLHVPQGGFQSLGNGNALWEQEDNQKRFKALWKAIAERYHDEPVIAGFDLLNEPVVTSSISQWQQLAQATIDSIRLVDDKHLVIVERVNAVGTDWSSNSDMNFFDLIDDKLVYEFHFYLPMEFTHQGASWMNPPLPTGQVYPDPSKLFVVGNPTWVTATFNTPLTPDGTFDWTYLNGESQKFLVYNSSWKIARPTLVNRGNTGKMWWDDIEVKEYDPSGNYVRTVMTIDLGDASGWYYWSVNNTGDAGSDHTSGNSSSNSLYIQGSTDDANYSNSRYRFIPKQGYYYSVSGWVKGENVPTTAQARFRIDFENGEAHELGKSYLASEVDKFYQWTNAKNRPLFLGEYGVIRYGYDANRGGTVWVSDMIDILKERNAHSTYHVYHEDNFGIYYGNGVIDVNNCNQSLIDLFTNKYR